MRLLTAVFRSRLHALRLFALALLLVTSLLLASTAAATAVFTAQGTCSISDGIGAFSKPAFDNSDEAVVGNTCASGVNAGQAQYFARSGEGDWSLDVESTARVHDIDGNVHGALISAHADLTFSDIFEITSSEPFNELQAKIQVTGGPPSVSGSPQNARIVTLYADAFAAFEILTPFGTLNLAYEHIVDEDGEAWFFNSLDTGLVNTPVLTNMVVSLDVIASVNAQTDINPSLTDPEASVGGSITAKSNFGNTFTWQGLDLSLDGVPLDPSSYTAFDDSGNDWSQPLTVIPEPGTALLFGAGLLGLAARRRRR